MISIVIPVYNAESTIVSSLNSILKQTYKEKIEIILVNDGSIDNSLKIITEYKKLHSDIPIEIINQMNSGVSKARNQGLKHARGEYLALLDSDDEWRELKLQKQMEIFQKNHHIDFLGTLRNDEQISFPYSIKDGLVKITLRKLLMRVTAQTSTVIFKRDILGDVGFFNEKLKYSEDANYWMHISKKKQMYLIPESLVVTGGGKPSFGFSGLSSNLVEMERGVQFNIDEMYKLCYITWLEYCFFKLFSKAKFFLRKKKAKRQKKNTYVL
ncbi:glycosyltransferase family 2 protein [Parapedobacter sp. DT-150]|uniref:glycosyltransferase family 2 protein n=1 Tax=Parapedobacter sp. DT-150 TaxID=3396162 RepID=UPI003F195EA8